MCQFAKKDGPRFEGAIDLAGSLKSLVLVVVVVVVVDMVGMMRNVCLCTWNRANRERNGGDGRQSESKFSH
jgi:hypothetical protein